MAIQPIILESARPAAKPRPWNLRRADLEPRFQALWSPELKAVIPFWGNAANYGALGQRLDGSFTGGTSWNGGAVELDGANGTYVSFPNTEDIWEITDETHIVAFVIRCRINGSLPATWTSIIEHTTATSRSGFRLLVNTNGSIQFCFGQSFDGHATSSGVFTADTWHTIGICVNSLKPSTDNYQIWLDGAQLVDLDDFAYVPVAADVALQIGEAHFGSSANELDGAVDFFAWWDHRVLDFQEMKLVTQDPYGLVRRKQVLYVPVAAGAATVEVPTGGSTCAASGSLTVTLQRVRSLTSTAASTGTQTSSLGRVRTAAETAASSGALTATLNRLASLTETCAASGALTATLEVAGTIAEISSTAASTGDLTAALNRLASLTETAASSGTLTATANRLASHAETCAGVGALTATLELATGPKAITETCAASGALTATLGRVRSLSETCAAVGAETATLTAIGPGIALLTSTASASGDLTASLSVLRSITSTMAGSGTLSETLSRLASITETAASSGALTATLATRPLAEITETCAGVGASTAALETQSDFVEGATRVFSSTARGRTFSASSGKTFT